MSLFSLLGFPGAACNWCQAFHVLTRWAVQLMGKGLCSERLQRQREQRFLKRNCCHCLESSSWRQTAWRHGSSLASQERQEANKQCLFCIQIQMNPIPKQVFLECLRKISSTHGFWECVLAFRRAIQETQLEQSWQGNPALFYMQAHRADKKERWDGLEEI